MNIAIITGASRGIGRAAAKRFAKEGYSLLLNCEKNWTLLEELQEEIQADLQENCPESIFAKIWERKKAFPVYWKGKAFLSCFFLPTAARMSIKLLQDYSEEETRTLLETNLLQPFILVKTYSPTFKSWGRKNSIQFLCLGKCGASMESLYS